MIRSLRALAVVSLALMCGLGAPSADAQQYDYPPASPQGPQPPASTQPPPGAQQPPSRYTAEELIARGNRFFGNVSEGLASLVERAVAQYGLPNGYILGQEGSAAFVGGVRYGEGTLYTKNAGQYAIFWQGPTIGADFGGSGDQVMMLVYNLPSVSAIYQRFPGVAGTAHVVAGLGMTVLARDNMYVVPIISGVGARLGINVGYLKFTDRPTWNPF